MLNIYFFYSTQVKNYPHQNKLKTIASKQINQLFFIIKILIHKIKKIKYLYKTTVIIIKFKNIDLDLRNKTIFLHIFKIF